MDKFLDLLPRISMMLSFSYPVIITSRLNPCFSKLMRSLSSIDFLFTRVRHLGELLVKGKRRLPVPAARSNAVEIRLPP